MGKTKQVIDAACFLFEHGVIDRVIVLTPASVRGVWFHKELGELAKHLWESIPATITEYHAKSRAWAWGPESQRRLQWTVTNYDFIRNSVRLRELEKGCGPRTLLVLDESSAVKNHRAKQSRAALTLRMKCGRVVLLNGTPIANSPMDMYAQGQIMDRRILQCKTFTEFRARYANFTTKHGFPQILGFINLDDLQRRFAPYVLRRLKEQCLDLPPKLPSVPIIARLTPATWEVYKAMRDDLCVWLENNAVSTAAFTVTKVMRLAQICSGFLGGVEEAVPEDPELEFAGPPPPVEAIKEVGREKLDAILEWYASAREGDPDLKLLMWSRFVPEVLRLQHELKPPSRTGLIIGLNRIKGYGKTQRAEAIELLDPRTAPAGAVTVFGTSQTGRTGLNLTAAHTVVYVSNDFSLFTRQQSEDRVHRPGQTHSVSYYDVIAEGPNGQKTIDHLIQAALRKKEDVANWTTSGWIAQLQQE